jgi:ABC-type dipeptide/oligopeptide/nickel transport system permease subunit
MQRQGEAPRVEPGGALIAARHPRRSEWARAWRRFKRYRPALFGLAVIALLIVLALIPGVFAPYDPYEPIPGMRGKGPSWVHPFGMDEIGRDLLSRVIYGSRIALLVGIAATGLSLVIGVSIGATAGYFGG